MSSQKAGELLRLVSTPPIYFCGDSFEKKLVTIRNKIEKHLESKGAEWVYEQYQQLSPSAKKTFLSLVKQKQSRNEQLSEQSDEAVVQREFS
jgi:hypothetical protein